MNDEGRGGSTFGVPIRTGRGQSPHIFIKRILSCHVDDTIIEDFVGSDHLQFKRKGDGWLLAG